MKNETSLLTTEKVSHQKLFAEQILKLCVCVCVCVGSEDGLLRGVEMAIGQMKAEESAKVTISSEYGFGETGNTEHQIPGGATLVYFIRLNSFQKVCSLSLYLSLSYHTTHTITM